MHNVRDCWTVSVRFCLLVYPIFPCLLSNLWTGHDLNFVKFLVHDNPMVDGIKNSEFRLQNSEFRLQNCELVLAFKICTNGI